MRNKLDKYANGGYPVFYFMPDINDNDVLCADCASEAGARAENTQVNWENAQLYCDNCSERIESAYAERSEERNNSDGSKA